jgi:hypothetical protein
MAKATAVTKTTVEQVTLTLSREEAEALTVVLYNVGGHPSADPRGNPLDKSPRGRIDDIHAALLDAGCETGYNLKRDNPKRYATGGSVGVRPLQGWQKA